MRSIHNKRYKAIIAYIRNKRIEAGITQKDMTHIMHLRQGIISKIETCERRLDLLELLQYCGGVNISIQEIVAYLDKMNASTK